MAKSVRFARRKRSSFKKRRAQIGKKSQVARVRRSRRRVKVMRGGVRPKNILLIIDPQVDFHPEGGEGVMYHSQGSLAVPGANQNSDNITSLIMNNLNKWDQIIVSMDTHNPNHIAHSSFWRNENEESPQPFAIITAEDITGGKWLPRDSSLKEYCIFYTKKLAENGRFDLIIWPPHCIQGSQGHRVVPNIETALQEWCKATGKTIDYRLKGQNNLTEMYSVIAADVEDPADPATQTNTDLLAAILDPAYVYTNTSPTTGALSDSIRAKSLFKFKTVELAAEEPVKIAAEEPVKIAAEEPVKIAAEEPVKQYNSKYNKVYICGQALSHCVAFTTRDLVKYKREFAPNLHVLIDCSSPVEGFADKANAFIDEVKKQKVNIIKSTDLQLFQSAETLERTSTLMLPTISSQNKIKSQRRI